MIIVCSLRAAPEQVALHRPSKVLGIVSPPTQHPSFESVTGDNHLRLTFNDIAMATPGLEAPGQQDLAKLMNFIKQWDQHSPLLIHCWAGISRSTASAYIAICMLQPEKDEEQLAWELREASPSATPNPMLIKLADAVLKRDGRMMRAIDNIGRGEDAFEGTPFQLSIA
jgi:predicted protein tyrosine phosphatase